ncbi:MAG: nucleoside deaminase, partial [Eubacteriales bacterium]
MNHQKDLELLRRAIVLSQEARDAGNTPFGALLADSDGNIIMEQGNQELTSHDCTMHAETGLMRRASQAFTKEVLWDCSLYTSAEPCCMCAGAIYWGNVGRIVYAMSEKMLLAATGDNEVNPTFDLNCREVLSKGQKPIVV